MVTLLINLFIKNKEDVESPSVRSAYATLSGMVGIGFNILLFAMKALIGYLSGSIAIVADAFNNLSDAGSSIVTMIGFRIAKHEADSEHPMGHGRSEYISGLVVAMIILMMGFELLKESIDKIIHPRDVEFSTAIIVILVVSMVIKFYMYMYNRSLAAKLNTPALAATAQDSLNDVFTTGAVLLSTVVGEMTSLRIDGICGLLVGAIIMKGGYDAFMDTTDLLLGHGADPEFVNKVKKLVGEYPDVLGVHDLVVHDYGPGRRVTSFHAEVPANGDMMVLHDTIDNIEKRVKTELRSQAVIHMDPIVVDDEVTNRARDMVKEMVHGIDPCLDIHDFRMVVGPTHTNLVFDVEIPYDTDMRPEDVKRQVTEGVRAMDSCYFAVVTICRS